MEGLTPFPYGVSLFKNTYIRFLWRTEYTELR